MRNTDSSWKCIYFSFSKPLIMQKDLLKIGLLLVLCLPIKAWAQDNIKQKTQIDMEAFKKPQLPAYLKPGDQVRLIAPAGVIHSKDPIYAAMKELESWGLKPTLGDYVFERAGHFSASDAHRLADLQAAMDDPEVKAIWAIRGGYGAGRIVDDLDFEKIKAQPKWLIGYSDITVLHARYNQEGLQSLHAMMPVNFKNPMDSIAESLASFKAVLFGEKPHYEIKGSSYNRTGRARGQLVGGNLSLLVGSVGTETDLDLDGKILFIEEVGEYRYHIDRMLRQMLRHGSFEGCKGLIIGDISEIRTNSTPFGRNTEELILDVVKDYDFPVLFGFPAGHENLNLALPLGREVVLISAKDKGELKFKSL
jgi:muramoyltetrapeptide carboxypeptidase